jgi:hypothetical protein
VAADLKGARDAVYAALTGSPIPKVKAVVRYEPAPGSLPAPASVSVASAGMNATDFLVTVRVYTATNSNVEWAADTRDDIVTAVEALLDTDTAWPRSDWTFVWAEDFDAFVGSCTLTVPRDDF